ncbi:hypothetical protein JTE90_023582, partial [Oedothorax gibbosus]
RASAKAEKLLETSAVSSDSPDEVIPIEKKKRNAKRPARYLSDEAILLSEEEESQSIISSKKYPLPKLPCSYKKLPKKIMSNSQTFLQSPGTSKQASQAVLQSIENQALTEKNQSALFHRMFRYMEKLDKKLNDLNDKVDRLMVRNTVDAPPHDFLPHDVELPFKTEQELSSFNERIKTDRELLAVMVNYCLHLKIIYRNLLMLNF